MSKGWKIQVPAGTTLYYRDLAYGEDQNKLQIFLKGEPTKNAWLKDNLKKYRNGDPNHTLTETAKAAYDTYTNPDSATYSVWSSIVTEARTDGKNGSTVKIDIKLPSFAFKKFEFNLTGSED